MYTLLGKTLCRSCSVNVVRYYNTVKKSVFISQSNNVYKNLALEDWIYKNSDLTNHHVLLVWRNDPCVVIGRHQNPWLEADVRSCENNRIDLVRRNSGGGTVYHDLGNLNLSFFTPRERYDRKYNLNIVTRALYREWGIRADINEREDIVVDGNFKVSGTAAKLGRPNAYHHCTLLVGVDKSALRFSLEKKEDGISTNATVSTRSPIKNLLDVNYQIRMESLISSLGWEYLRTKPNVLEDGGYEHIQKQKGFQMINPTEDWFPGIEKLANEFRSWEWIYGKTPKFILTREIAVPGPNDQTYSLNLTLDVQAGKIEEIKIKVSTELAKFDRHSNIIASLRGNKYDREVLDNVITALGCKTLTSKIVDEKNNMVASQ